MLLFVGNIYRTVDISHRMTLFTKLYLKGHITKPKRSILTDRFTLQQT